MDPNQKKKNPAPVEAPAVEPTPVVEKPADPTPVVEAQAADELKTVEALADEKATPDWLFAAAKMKHGWAIGSEVTPAAFDAAIAVTLDEPIGRGNVPTIEAVEADQTPQA